MIGTDRRQVLRDRILAAGHTRGICGDELLCVKRSGALRVFLSNMFNHYLPYHLKQLGIWSQQNRGSALSCSALPSCCKIKVSQSRQKNASDFNSCVHCQLAVLQGCCGSLRSSRMFQSCSKRALQAHPFFPLRNN